MTEWSGGGGGGARWGGGGVSNTAQQHCWSYCIDAAKKRHLLKYFASILNFSNHFCAEQTSPRNNISISTSGRRVSLHCSTDANYLKDNVTAKSGWSVWWSLKLSLRHPKVPSCVQLLCGETFPSLYPELLHSPVKTLSLMHFPELLSKIHVAAGVKSFDPNSSHPNILLFHVIYSGVSRLEAAVRALGRPVLRKTGGFSVCQPGQIHIYCGNVSLQYGRLLLSGSALYLNTNSCNWQTKIQQLFILNGFTQHKKTLYHFMLIDPSKRCPVGPLISSRKTQRQ